MSGKQPQLPAGYEMLVHGKGPRDIAIQSEATVELMKASKEQRAALSGAVEGFAMGRPLPERMSRIPESWYPTPRARRRVRLTALTPTDITAYGSICALRGRSTFIITGIDLCDASPEAELEHYASAGDEALRLAAWLGEEGGSRVAVSKAR